MQDRLPQSTSDVVLSARAGQLAVLRELFLVRDKRAREVDRPPFKVLGNRTLRPIHMVGLLLGLVGVLMMSAESVVDADAGLSGVLFVIIALLGYAVTASVTGPLAERYGAVALVVVGALGWSTWQCFQLADRFPTRLPAEPAQVLQVLRERGSVGDVVGARRGRSARRRRRGRGGLP